ncbi:MAG: undecaprenyl-diphosphate phosphatase [Clostridiales bacterium]|nr:undecaprenyl-diphosphate phosphatase [Clostridiales bacterium]
MTIWEAVWKSVILGTVQGLTEFLPVSSSGHLVLLQKLLGYDLAGGSMMFVNIMLHFGTLLAVLFVFRKDILALFKKPFKTLVMLIVATVPAGLVGLFFSDKIDETFAGDEGLLYLAVCFAVTALFLLICELVAKQRKKHAPLGWKSTIPMGLAQATAVLPGISRSGSTIVAGTLCGAKTEEGAKFSFLMMIPIILGSVAVSLKGVIFDEKEALAEFGAAGIVGVIVGVVCAAIAGFFAIKVMLKIIGKANYKWFSFYLVLLSLTCFWLNVLGLY